MRALAICLLLILSGCIQGETVPDQVDGADSGVRYHHDAEHGVGCWSMWSRAISCLPDSEYSE